ncbi:MAG: hypothetical protein A4E41_00938 [Methanoregulaceae archaeon PtaU1.Bin066]|nr:MAG: hypothetical protein A4E41_00938 [Methanoregulaceae archaeon PtaU1.Bin066]
MQVPGPILLPFPMRTCPWITQLPDTSPAFSADAAWISFWFICRRSHGYTASCQSSAGTARIFFPEAMNAPTASVRSFPWMHEKKSRSSENMPVDIVKLGAWAGFSRMLVTYPLRVTTTPKLEGYGCSFTSRAFRTSRILAIEALLMKLSPGSTMKRPFIKSFAWSRAWAVPSCFSCTTTSTLASRLFKCRITCSFRYPTTTMMSLIPEARSASMT